MSFAIEQFYKLFQGALVFQCIYMAILFGITKRKDAIIYSMYLLLLVIYFFVNAPFTFFNINDDIVFEYQWQCATSPVVSCLRSRAGDEIR